MFVLRLIVAAGSFTTLISGAPVPSLHFLNDAIIARSTPSSIEQRDVANVYKVFAGNGEATEGWPTVSQWLSFDTMFSSSQGVLKSGCSQFGVAENSDAEIADTKSAIQSVASSTGVDERFILAIVMQESNGCVRAPTTNYGVRNPGLMQSHDGSGTCNDGSVQNPCPASAITQMIQDGVGGTAAGDGLKQCIAASGATDVSMYYKAARIYNSGSIAASQNLGDGIATHCYATDIANRLTGWFSGVSACDPNTIASLSGTATTVSSDDSDNSAASPSAVAASTPATTSAGGIFVALPTTTPTPTPAAVAPIATSAPVASPSTTSVAATTPTASSAPVDVAPIRGSDNSGSTDTSSTSSSTTTTSSVGAETVGSACTSEGLWNCISGSSFQQCASGTWSAVQSLAAGMQCVTGQSMVFSTSAIAS